MLFSDVPNDASRPLILGVIGAGRWGRHWVRVCSSLRGARLGAVCDSNPERARELSARFGEVPWFATAHEMLERGDIDGVVVATPTSSHASLALCSLAAGCHVLVEKPLAANRVDAHEVASHRGGRVMVGHLLRYHPGVVKIQRMIEAGELGAVTHVLCERLGAQPSAREETSWWALAPHDISVMRFLLGSEPESIQAASTAGPGRHPEDAMSALLVFPGGRLGVIRVGGAAAQRVRRITVVGERRSVTFTDQDGAPRLSHYRAPVCFDPLGAEAAPAALPEAAALHEEEVKGGEPLALQGQHFVDCLRHGEPFASDGWEGLAVVRVLEAGSLALSLGHSVRVVADATLGCAATATLHFPSSGWGGVGSP